MINRSIVVQNWLKHPEYLEETIEKIDGNIVEPDLFAVNEGESAKTKKKKSNEQLHLDRTMATRLFVDENHETVTSPLQFPIGFTCSSNQT